MAVLDASFLLDLDRGHAPARLLLGALVDEGRPLVVPAPVLLAFLANARDPARAEREVAERFDVLAFAPEDAARAASIARKARPQGSSRWVALAAAGVALRRGEALVTADEEAFRGVEGLDVLTYRR